MYERRTYNGAHGARTNAKLRGRVIRGLILLLLVLVVGALGWCCWVYMQIESYASQDQAAPADAIGVLGAAEYDGRPSPVYRARLDHALELYHRGIAPLIITLGGNGGDQFTEGSVGEDYLISKGVPGVGHHCRDGEPQYRGVGPPHRRHRPRQRSAPPGRGQ